MIRDEQDCQGAAENSRQQQFHAYFETEMFRIESDDSELDKHPLGEDLARWFGSKLKPGYSVGEPVSEDWGWALPIACDGQNLWLMLQKWHSTERGWHVWLEPRGLLSSLFKRRTRVATGRARDAIGRVLANEHQVEGLRWLSNPEELE